MKYLILVLVLMGLAAHAEDPVALTQPAKKSESATCTVSSDTFNQVMKISIQKGEDLFSTESGRKRLLLETDEYDISYQPGKVISVDRQIRDEKGEQTGSTLAFLADRKLVHYDRTPDDSFVSYTIECK